MFFRGLIWRPLRQDVGRTALSLLAVALGVAVVIAIRVANRSAVGAFRQGTQTLSGGAALLVTGPQPLSAALLTKLFPLNAEAEFHPYLQRRAYDPAHDDVLNVLGLDLLAARGRPRQAASPPSTPSPAPRARPRAGQPGLGPGGGPFILIPSAYALRHHLRAGDALRLTVGGRPVGFTVGAVLPPGSETSGPDYALLDLPDALAAFEPGRASRQSFDGLRVDLAPGVKPGAIIAALRPLIPAADTVAPPGNGVGDDAQMLAAFRANLSALAYVSLLIGVFLIYNTISISVVRRRQAIATLRAMGATRRRVVALFLGEGVALAVCGGVLGWVLGWLMAEGALALVQGTISRLSTSLGAVTLVLEPSDLIWSLGVAAAAGAMAALAPALSAARIAPAAALRAGGAELETRSRRGWAAVAALTLAALAWVLARLPEPGTVPIFGFACALAAVLAGAALAPPALGALLPPLRRALLATRRLAAGLAAAGLAGALRRSSVLTAALAIAIGVMLGVAIMVGSFRQTVETWIGQQLQADVFIRSSDWTPNRPTPLSAGVIEAVETTPGVAAVAAGSMRTWTLQGRQIDVTTRWALSGNDSAQPRYQFLSGGPARGGGGRAGAPGVPSPAERQAGRAVQPRGVPRPSIGDGVIVGEPFARRFHLWTGDGFQLSTPAGWLPLRVDGVFYDYAGERGQVVLDRALYTRAFGPPAPTELGVIATPGVDSATLRRRLERLPALAGVSVNDNRSLRAQAMHIFDRTFRITYALEGITLLVAILGVGNTLLAVVLERGREFALLRFLGATRAQIRAVLLAEAGILATAALALGWAMGVALALILVRVINVQSFGWTIQFHPPFAFLLPASAAVWVATLLAGWLPARAAQRVATPAALEAE